MADIETADLGGATTPATGEDLDLRGRLEKLYDDMTADDGGQGGDGQDGEAARADRLRDQRGRFAAPSTEVPNPATAGQATTDQPAAAGAGQPQAATGAPQSWSDAAKAKWAALPPDIQAEIARRESDVQKGFQQRGEAVARAEPIIRALEPHAVRLREMGLNEGDAVNNLVRIYDQALKDPLGYIRWFAQEVGIDRAKLVDLFSGDGKAGGGRGDEPFVDPQLAALENRFSPIDQRLAAMEARENARQAVGVMNEVKAFAEALGQDGKPLRPHFNDLEDEICDELERLRAKNPRAANAVLLQQAYERAVYLNPTVREKVIAARAIPPADPRKAVEKAREAQGANIRPRPSPAAPNGAAGKGKTLRETMENAYDAIAG